ncbi:MAG: TIGR01212 family radical SAM protein [Mailhella sp.]|nr:TIGR01212 family radical SAM protein [Mailhella sp.]
MAQEKPYFSFDAYLKQIFGQKVQKIPLDAGSSCPNRDGTLGTGGCSFCNASGAGSGLSASMTLAEQWDHWRRKYAVSDRLKHTTLFLAYIQSFTNTYGPAERIRRMIGELAQFSGLAGLCIGTRPDCVDGEKLAILADTPWKENWIEFGVQSMNDATLKRINRRHDAACSVQAIQDAHDAGLKVCAHLMAGLPGESPEDFLETVKSVCRLPIDGVKLHGLYVCEGSAIADDWLAKRYAPMGMETYAETIAEALTMIPPRIIIHRLTADPGRDELLAPSWASEKGTVVRRIEELLFHDGKCQGSALPHAGSATSAVP